MCVIPEVERASLNILTIIKHCNSVLPEMAAM